MKLHKATEPPPPRPMLWDKEARYMVEPGRRAWNDFEMRRSMERALSFEHEAIVELTKLLAVHDLRPLHSVRVTYPFIMSPTPYPPEGLPPERDTENTRLKEFAFDAQDALDEYFGGSDWRHWFVAPYMNDDNTFYLGVFVDETFVTEVVE